MHAKKNNRNVYLMCKSDTLTYYRYLELIFNMLLEF